MHEEVDNNTPVPITDNKSNTCNASDGTQEIKRFDRPVSIAIHSQRNRLTDSDGAFSKYVIDAIVTAGVLQDDSPEHIPESPRKTQEKVAGQEYTIITIEAILGK